MGKLMASLGAVCIFFGLSVLAGAKPMPAQSSAVAGTASVSGTVDSGTPFKAAEVFIRNTDKRILYMVYTNAGQFRAVTLFPGNYEVKVSTKGLESDVQKLTLKAGENPKLKLPKPQKTADTPKIQVTKDGAIWYSPRRSLDAPAFGVLYPDMDKITTLGAYYQNGPPGYPYKLAAPTTRASR